MNSTSVNNTTRTNLLDFNTAQAAQAKELVLYWCAAPAWASAVVSARPYATLEDLQTTTQTLWQDATNNDLLLAFAAHPVIGDVELLRSKYAGQANTEQGQVLEASSQIIEELASQNIAYRERHGFTFIVFATGKTAQQMLSLLKARISNSSADELRNAAIEQLKIMQLRLEQSFTANSPSAPS